MIDSKNVTPRIGVCPIVMPLHRLLCHASVVLCDHLSIGDRRRGIRGSCKMALQKPHRIPTDTLVARYTFGIHGLSALFSRTKCRVTLFCCCIQVSCVSVENVHSAEAGRNFFERPSNLNQASKFMIPALSLSGVNDRVNTECATLYTHCDSCIVVEASPSVHILAPKKLRREQRKDHSVPPKIRSS
eukprot:gb/GECG01014055.1/.p1 GENE.gb/GECG01014055.1/~~gb/GECG01014055.1/.p1  ORF type:complete len:187 (+),score=2.60 gb/GECG01014055.1/:1-561(+)